MATTPRQKPAENLTSQSAAGELQTPQPLEDFTQYLKDYAREKPEMAALWCFGVGFVLGWKLKPW